MQYYLLGRPSSLNIGKIIFLVTFESEYLFEQKVIIKYLRCGNLEPFAHLAPPYGLVIEIIIINIIVIIVIIIIIIKVGR